MSNLQLIKYWQDVPKETYHAETREIESAGTERVHLEVTLDSTSPDYAGQIAAIESYCGNDYTIENVKAEIEPLEQLKADVDYLSIMTGVNL